MFFHFFFLSNFFIIVFSIDIITLSSFRICFLVLVKWILLVILIISIYILEMIIIAIFYYWHKIQLFIYKSHTEIWWGTMCKSLTIPVTVRFNYQVRMPLSIVRCWMMVRKNLVLLLKINIGKLSKFSNFCWTQDYRLIWKKFS